MATYTVDDAKRRVNDLSRTLYGGDLNEEQFGRLASKIGFSGTAVDDNALSNAFGNIGMFKGEFAAPAAVQGPITASLDNPLAPKFNAPTFTPPPAFQAPGMDSVYNDPGYQRRISEGTQALEQSQAAKGVLRTGGSLKELINYGQQMASDEYGKVYDRAKDAYATQFGAAESTFDRNLTGEVASFGGNLQGTLATVDKDWREKVYNQDDEYRKYVFKNETDFREKVYSTDDAFRKAVQAESEQWKRDLMSEERLRFLSGMGM